MGWKKRLFVFALFVMIFFVGFISATRLPTVGGDTDSWGTVLNDYLNNSLGENATSLNVSSGNITLGQKITFALGGVIDNIITGWITITGGLNVTGNAVVNGTLNISGNAVVDGDLNVTGDFIVNNSDFYVNTTSGNVGIGISNSLNRLTVGDYDASNSSLSVDNAQLNQLEDGGYFGKIALSQNPWLVSSNYWNSSTQVASSQAWEDIAMSSDGKYQTAVTDGQIYISSDYGMTWTAVDSVRGWDDVAMSADGKYQTAVVDGGQIYVSTDYGATWTAKDSNRQWRGVAMSSDGKIQNAVEFNLYSYISADYGNTWTAGTAPKSWGDIAMSSDGKIQTGIIPAGNIVVSTDYGVTWSSKGSTKVWTDIAMSSDGKIQTATAQNNNIYISSDYGSTWTAKASSQNWRDVAMTSDGRVQTAVVSGGQIYVSTDYGATWTAKDSSRNWKDVAMSADGRVQAATDYDGLNGKGFIYISFADSYVSHGNIGIGTASPNSTLDVNGSAVIQGNLNVTGTSTSYNITLNNILSKDGNVSLNNTLYIINNGKTGVGTNDPQVKFAVTGSNSSYTGSSTSGIFQLTTGTGGDASEAILMGIVESSYHWIQAAKPGTSTRSLVLQPGGGSVGIGKVNPITTLDVNGNASFESSDVPLKLRESGTSAGKYWIAGPDIFNAFVVYNQDNTGVFITDGATSWTANSDRRLKKNITNLSTDKGLNAIMKLNPVNYNWKDVRSPKVQQTGFIAQEVQDVFPEVVSSSPTKTIILEDGSNETIDEPLGISMTALIPNIVKAIQELNTKVDALAAGNYTVNQKNTFSSDRIGTATIKANETSVDITFQSNYSSVPVVTVTPLDFTNGQYRVTDKSVYGFRIELQKFQDNDIDFDWHAFAPEENDKNIESVLNVSLNETTNVTIEDNPNITLQENTTNEIIEIPRENDTEDSPETNITNFTYYDNQTNNPIEEDVNNANETEEVNSIIIGENISEEIGKESADEISSESFPEEYSGDSTVENPSNESVAPVTGGAIGTQDKESVLIKLVHFLENLFN